MSLKLLTSTKPVIKTDLERCLERYTAEELFSGSNQVFCDTCTFDTFGPESNERVRCDTIKRDLIIHLPAVLIIHLKRFEQVNFQLQKCSKKVTFPILLNMSSFCSRLSTPRPHGTKVMYRLFGIVEHWGTLLFGHYVSYVAVEPTPTGATTTNRRHLPDVSFLAPRENPLPWPMTKHHLVKEMLREKKETIHEEKAASKEDMQDDRQWFFCSDSQVYPADLTDIFASKPYVLFYERVV